MMMVRTGVSSILVLALDTVMVSMLRMMSLTEGERSFRATSPDGVDAPRRPLRARVGVLEPTPGGVHEPS